MRYLCLDTSAGASVALVDTDAVTPLGTADLADPRAHSEQLAELVRTALARAGYDRLADAGIDRIVCGTGPAPFTGLRAGLVSARTFAVALGVPVVGVASIDALARATLDIVKPPSTLVVTLDARRREIYAAGYRALGANDVTRVWGPEVNTPAQIARRSGTDDLIAGPGAALYPDELPCDVPQPDRVEAATLARLAHARLSSGSSLADLDTQPLYLRGADIHGVPRS